MHPSAEQEAQFAQPSAGRDPAAASSSSDPPPAAASSSSDQLAAKPKYHRLRLHATADQAEYQLTGKSQAEYHQSGKSQPAAATTDAVRHRGRTNRPTTPTTPAEYQLTGKSRVVAALSTERAEQQAAATLRAKDYHDWRATQTQFPPSKGLPVTQIELPPTDPHPVFRQTHRITDKPNTETPPPTSTPAANNREITAWNDGWEKHFNPDQQELDNKPQNRLAILNWNTGGPRTGSKGSGLGPFMNGKFHVLLLQEAGGHQGDIEDHWLFNEPGAAGGCQVAFKSDNFHDPEWFHACIKKTERDQKRQRLTRRPWRSASAEPSTHDCHKNPPAQYSP